LIKADASRYTKADFSEWSAEDGASRASQEYLETLDDAAFGAATPVKPKAISPTNPATRFTGANGDRPFFAYSTNYLVDLDNAIIVDVEATAPIRQAEVGAVRHMLTRTRERFDLHPDTLAADTAYGTAEMTSNRTSRSSTNPSARTAPIRPPTSPTMKRQTNTAAPEGRR
jgi:hypothetical protein